MPSARYGAQPGRLAGVAKAGQRKPGFGLAGLAVTLAMASSAAHAGFLDGKTYSNISIDGTAYNISFQDGSYDDVYASTPPTFLNNPAAAHDAAEVLYTLFLQTPHVIGVIPNDYDAAWVPYANGATRFNGWIVDNVTASESPAAGPTDESGPNSNDYTPFGELFSVFTPVNPGPPGNPEPPRNCDLRGLCSAAPEPATWATLILGLGAVGVVMRRRRKVALAAL